MKKLLALLFACFASLSQAQDLTNHAVAIGGGPGFSGFRAAGPCAGGQALVWSAATVDPTCAGVTTGLNVKNFGATGDGVTNDTTAINNALTAASGKSLLFPCGTYLVSSINAIPISTALIGEAFQCAIIKTNSATLDVITISTGYVTIDNLSIQSSVTRSAGSYININNVNGWVRVSNFSLQAPFIGINIGTSSTVIFIDHGEILNAVAATGNSIIISGGNPVKISKVIMNNSAGARPFSHIQIPVSPGEITLDNIEAINAINNLYIAPGNGQTVTSLKSINSWFDHAGNYNMIVTPTGTGVFQRSSFVGSWFGTSGIANINLDGTGTKVIDGITFTDNDYLDSPFGLAAAGPGVKNLQVTGGKFAGLTTSAIQLDGITSASINDARIGQSAGFGVNLVGITLLNATDNISIGGNDLRANTTAVTNTASGTNIIFNCNLGYNPCSFPTGLVQGDLTYTSATNGIMSRLAKDTNATRYLANTGTTNNPAWAQVNLANGVTGTLPVANGGWGDAGTAWASYTPSLSCTVGTLTSATATGKSKTVGKTTFVSITISITTLGTCATQIIASLPNTTQNITVLVARETTIGNMGSGSAAAGTTSVGITKYDATFLGGNGQSITVNGVYENQ